jgi:sulfur dioxygenase
MRVEQLFDPTTSTYSYLLWDEKTKQAALIDSVKE